MMEKNPTCTDCGGTGVAYQTERRCACQSTPTPTVRGDDLALRLRAWCIDFDGSALVRETTPRDGLHCDLLYDAADEISRLKVYIATQHERIDRLETAKHDWDDDPSSDERWNSGVDYAQTQLCHVLNVDPKNVNWDAATEELESDVQYVIRNILTEAMGEDWPDALKERHEQA